MSQQILKYLDNIKFYENSILNGAHFTCRETSPKHNPCQNCLSCKLFMIVNFSVSLLNHMTVSEIVEFIKNCSKSISQPFLTDILRQLLSSLKSKDRTYSLSRAKPSLDTDLMDFSMKNFTVNKNQLSNVTNQISLWIVQQPDTFRLQFIFSLLSNLKLAILSEIYRSIHNYDLNLFHKEMEGNITDDMQALSNNKPTLLRIHEECQTDFISALPIHISKMIISMLDEKSLKICSTLCKSWSIIVIEVKKECIANKELMEQAMLLQSVSINSADATFARDKDVRIPMLDPVNHRIMYKEKNNFDSYQDKNSCISNTQYENESFNSPKISFMDKVYKNIVTKTVIIEERNIFCGGYSAMPIMESSSKHKSLISTISFTGGRLVIIGGQNKVIQFLDVDGKQLDIMKRRIHGHAGSIKVLRAMKNPGKIISTQHQSAINVHDKESEILSGSYDTTIRRWDTASGKCLKIYMGHTSTITDIDIGEDHFLSGSLDGTCKLWKYNDKHSYLTMRHNIPVSSVALSNKLCISGDTSGVVKVWDIQNGRHIKDLIGHQKEISAIKMDRFHIVSSSLDNSVMMWSSIGDFQCCIGHFRHPKPVLCMEFLYLRVISGCEDGKIRIWNVLNGQCIRIIRGNSKSDPILNLVANGDTIVINTTSNILVLRFEPVNWIYGSDLEECMKFNNKPFLEIQDQEYSDTKLSNCKHTIQRYERSRFAGNIDPRIYLNPSENLEKLNSTKKDENCLFQNLRLFENGTVLSRSSTWLISPTLNKTISLSKEPCVNRDISEKTLEENKLISIFNENISRENNSNLSGRRVSYGFETQDHLVCTIGLNDMKQAIRKHIRSPPHISLESMPDSIKEMVLQLKMNSRQRKLNSASYNFRNRPSSGPSKIDSKSKLSIDQIKKNVKPSLSVNKEVQNLQKKPTIKPKSSISEINKTASNQNIQRAVAESFLFPPDFKKNLNKRKLEFIQRHNICIKQPTTQHISLSSDNLKNPESIQFCSNLKLHTFETSQQYLDQIDKVNQDFELEQKMKAQEKYRSNWLKKATASPNLKYEKDALMKRPRSAII